MTATAERPGRPRDRQGPAPQGGPAADHRAHPLDRQHRRCRACCTWPWCAARSRTRRSPASTPAPPRPRPTSSTCSPARTSATSSACASTPGRSRPTRSRPTTRRCRPTGSRSPARSSRSSWPAPPPRPATPPSSSTSSTTSCRPRSTSRRRPTDKVLAHPDSGTNKSALWVFDSGEAGTGGNVEEAIEKARADGIVIEREYRQQRLIPAFMEPRSVVVDPTGEQLTMWSATQIPHILRFALAATTGVPESKIRVIAPDVGGGFGGKLQVTPEEWIAWAVARRIWQAGQVHRDPQREPAERPPRPRPVAEADPRRDQGRHGHRLQGRPARRPRGVRRDRRRRRAGARRVHVQRDLQVPRLPVRLPDRAHQQDLDRRLPRRRPAGGDVRHRADDGRARRRGRRRPARDPREELDQARGVPVHHGGRADLRLRQLRGGHGQGQGDVRVRRAAGRAEAAARRAATGSSSGIGISTFTEMCGLAPEPGARAARLRRRRLGARRRADAGHRQGRGRHRRRARTARATRRRSARSSPTGSACRSRTSRSCTATRQVAHKGLDTYGSRSLVGRRRGTGPGGRQGDREGQADRGAPARGQRRRRGVRGRHVLGQGHRPGHDASRRSRSRRSRRTTIPEGIEPNIDAEATYDPVNFSFPHGTHLCAMEVDTETGQVDDAQVRLRATTSATSSTR